MGTAVYGYRQYSIRFSWLTDMTTLFDSALAVLMLIIATCCPSAYDARQCVLLGLLPWPSKDWIPCC